MAQMQASINTHSQQSQGITFKAGYRYIKQTLPVSTCWYITRIKLIESAVDSGQHSEVPGKAIFTRKL